MGEKTESGGEKEEEKGKRREAEAEQIEKEKGRENGDQLALVGRGILKVGGACL